METREVTCPRCAELEAELSEQRSYNEILKMSELSSAYERDSLSKELKSMTSQYQGKVSELKVEIERLMSEVAKPFAKDINLARQNAELRSWCERLADVAKALSAADTLQWAQAYTDWMNADAGYRAWRKERGG